MAIAPLNFPSECRWFDHQISHFLQGFISVPAAHLNHMTNSLLFCTEPMTRNRWDAWESLMIEYIAVESLVTEHHSWAAEIQNVSCVGKIGAFRANIFGDIFTLRHLTVLLKLEYRVSNKRNNSIDLKHHKHLSSHIRFGIRFNELPILIYDTLHFVEKH